MKKFARYQNLALLLGALVIAFIYFRNSFVDFDKDPETGVQFLRQPLDEVLQKAATENQLVFIDVYATWCGPCKRMKATTFSNEALGGYLNDNFVSATYDGETAEGRKVMMRYQLNAYPSLLVLNEKGDLLTKFTGYHSVADLKRVLRKFE